MPSGSTADGLTSQVNCLTAFYYEEAIARASQLDEVLKNTGKPVGPLHGLPVAIKVKASRSW